MIFALPKVNKDGVYAIHDTPQNRLGEYFCDNKDNRLWVYVRANRTISKGASVQPFNGPNINSGLKTTVAGAKTLEFATSVNLVRRLPKVPTQPRNADYATIYVEPTTGDAQYGIVRSHTAHSCNVEWLTSDDGTLKVPFAADDDVTFEIPWLVIETVDEGVTVGFAQRDIAEGKYFWALVEGIGLGLNDSTSLSTGSGSPLWSTGSGAVHDSSPSNDITMCASCMVDTVAANTVFPIIAAANARIGIPPLQRTSDFQGAYQPPTI